MLCRRGTGFSACPWISQRQSGEVNSDRLKSLSYDNIMAQAYTPGLKVARRTWHRCRRVLPIAGEVLVPAGAQVAARDVVAQTFMPGPVTPVNVANLLSVPPDDVASCLLKKTGERVALGEPLARNKGMFGWFKTECPSPADGTIESVSNVTGQVILRGEPLPVQVRAFLAGSVVDVLPHEGCSIEAEVTYLQGIFGVGGEAFGLIHMACDTPARDLTPDLIRTEMKDRIVIGGARVTAEAIARAKEVGAAAIVSGGIDDQDLRDFLGYDLGVAVTGSENLGLTLIITEGFGDIAMADRTFQLLASRAGADAAVNGATQIRAGVMRPEVIVPWGAEAAGPHGSASGTKSDGARRDTETGGLLAVGVPVRIIRDPYFGMIGSVAALPSDPQVLPSGSRARILDVRLPDARTVTVPRANVELIEG